MSDDENIYKFYCKHCMKWQEVFIDMHPWDGYCPECGWRP
jgi:hypothetical protein